MLVGCTPMRAVILTDPGMAPIALTLQVVMEAKAHQASCVTNTRLLFDRERPSDIHIVNVVRDFNPDWIIMHLDGDECPGRIDLATAIQEEVPAARFLFFGSYPHEKDLDLARSRGLVFHFRFAPFSTEEFLAAIEQAA